MNDDINFQDLDVAVADLLKDSRDDAETERDRDEIVESEKAEVRRQWNLPREAKDKSATSVANRIAKNSDTMSSAPSTRRQAGRRGHFMDMINPSSDMALAKKPNHAAAANSNIIRAEQVFDHLKEPVAVASDQPSSLSNEHRLKSTLSAGVSSKKMANASTPDKMDSQSPFLVGVKVDKTPLGATKPTGAAPAMEAMLPVDENPSTNPVDPEPEIELSEDNFISRFLDDINDKGATARPVTADTVTPKSVHSSELDHLPRDNTEQAPVDDRRAKLDSSMIRPQYHSSETAQITEAPTPFRAVVANDKISATETKHHVIIWILIFIFLLMIGFCLGAWWWLAH